MMNLKGVFCVLLISLTALSLARELKSHRITNVPFHRQITRWACGDASFEMVYHYARKDLDQRAIINVARSSSHNGTATYDLIRSAHFSKLSAAPTDLYYPNQSPQAGWVSDIPYGMAAFGFRGESCWIEELKDLIAEGYPVIVLNRFSESSPGGHFRVAVGFNETSITFLDPWDRNWDRVVTFTDEVYCSEIWTYPKWWNYYTSPPFWGGIFTPWKVEVEYEATLEKQPLKEYHNFIKVRAKVTYPCPKPFCSESQHHLESTVHHTNMTLSLPPNMILVNSNQNLTVELGDFLPGSHLYAEWDVEVDDSLNAKFALGVVSKPIRVEAVGLLRSAVPKAFCCYDENGADVWYPPYEYSDLLGAFGEAHY